MELVNVAVVVNGSAAQSPRTMHHVEMLLQQNNRGSLTFIVHLFAYPPLPSSLDDTHSSVDRTSDRYQLLHTYFRFHPLPSPSFALRQDHNQSQTLLYSLQFASRGILAASTRSIALLKQLIFCGAHLDIILVQIPPSIPTLACVHLARLLSFFSNKRTKSRHTKVLLDWHNFGYTLLSVAKAPHFITYFAKMYEKVLSSFWIEHHFCVSKAMQLFLQTQWRIHSHVFYDKPSSQFHPCSRVESKELFVKLSQEYALSSDLERIGRSSDEDYGRDTNFMCVSSTSWTADEDFELLENAMVILDEAVDVTVWMFITGKGPLRSEFERRWSLRNWRNVRLQTVWLSRSDYIALLGSAHVGICLHSSSSGLDLPMKVVDMFGCGLPVLAMDFECIQELVTDQFGLLFRSAEELAQQLRSLIEAEKQTNPASHGSAILNTRQVMRENVVKQYSSAESRADAEWNRVVLPVIQDALGFAKKLS
mmetsp:Transcript_7624/g.13814  ORF Transcript_7624/g.13814 Transcript_7624/m.13814 type:complete len:478 (-) Transcript_7624:1741-3174(-)